MQSSREIPVSLLFDVGRRVFDMHAGFEAGPPLRHMNKSNARYRGRGRSKQWRDVATYERQLQRAAIIWCPGKPEPTESDGLLVFVEVRLGVLVAKNGARHKGKTRAKKHDVDGVKAILDALNGIAYVDDHQIETVISRMRAREDDEDAVGDLVTVSVYEPRAKGGQP